MQQVIQLFETHGVLGVFLAVFVEQAGAPIPAVPFLLLAGAQGAGNPAYLARALLAATVASVLADVLWFKAGRRFGRSVLGLLCRVSLSPDTCVRKTELSFTKRGAWTIVFAKFIPGASTLARPLAGALGMGARAFFFLNLLGTLLWVGSSLAAGVLLRSEVAKAMQSLQDLGDAALLALVSALGLYVAWRATRRIAARRMIRGLPRVTAAALAQRMAAGEDILLLDVRSAASSGALRAAGAMAAPLGSAAMERAPEFARASLVVTYCDCPGDVTAARAAMQLARRGCRVHILEGGLDAWKSAALPLEAGDRAAGVREDNARGAAVSHPAQATAMHPALAAWGETGATLHRWMQIGGKTASPSSSSPRAWASPDEAIRAEPNAPRSALQHSCSSNSGGVFAD